MVQSLTSYQNLASRADDYTFSMSKSVVPMVVEQSGMGERAFDLYSRLLRERIIFLGTGIDDTVADSIVAQLLFLDADDAEKDIQLYVNSPGGSVDAGLLGTICQARMALSEKWERIGLSCARRIIRHAGSTWWRQRREGKTVIYHDHR